MLRPLLFLPLEPLLWDHLGGETTWPQASSGMAETTWSAQGPAYGTLQCSEKQDFTGCNTVILG